MKSWVLFILLTSLTAHSATYNIAPSDDASVALATPSTPGGSVNPLLSDLNGVSRKESRFFLKFSIPALVGSISSVKLQMNIVNPSANSPKIYQVSSLWNESSLVYSSSIVKSGLLLDLGATVAGSLSSNLPASSVVSGGILSLGFYADSTDGFSINSKENGSNAPSLIIETIEPSTGSGSGPVVGTNIQCHPDNSPYIPRNIWVWNTNVISDFNANNPEDAAKERGRFFLHAKKTNVKGIYLSAKTIISAYTSNSTSSSVANLRSFIKEAKDRCMDTHLLIGNGGSYIDDAAAASGYASLVDIANKALLFSAQSPANSKPVALHFDIEPHQLSAWSNDTASGYPVRKQLLSNYAAGIKKVKDILIYTDLKLAIDVPHWYDSSSYAGINCNGITRDPYMCLIDLVHEYVLMNYRDKAGSRSVSGSTTVRQGMTELNYANISTNVYGGKTYIIQGQESGDLGADIGLTFYEEIRNVAGSSATGGQIGWAYMEQQFQKIQQEFSLSSDVANPARSTTVLYNASEPRLSRYNKPAANIPAGIAIHHYDSINSQGSYLLDPAILMNYP
jgi:hypothetical protein